MVPQATDTVHARQRDLYDQLWRRVRTNALSPDLIRFRVWLKHLRPPVVDIGAGDALLSRSFPDIGIISIDLSDIGIREVAGRALAGAAEALPLRGGGVGTVVLSEVLEHVDDTAAVLNECRRIVRRDGVVLLSTPVWPIARAEELYFWRKIHQRPTLANISLWDPQHERRFELRHLLALVAHARLEVVEVIPLFGSASTAGLYVVEPLLQRALRRPVRLAHRLTGLDRVLRPVDHNSAVALICRPA